MKILNLVQGSPEWDAARATRMTASEAPAMMSATKKMSRNELLKAKSLGTEKEVSEYVQKFLFDKGHEMEAAARPIVEEIIGEELYPTTGETEDGVYLASFDGMTMMGDVLFEHKMWNESLAEAVRNEKLPAEYYWQLEHQLMVADEAEKVIFVVSDGTKENFEYMWYTPIRGRRNKLIKGWEQFKADLAEFEPAPAKEEVVAEKPNQLPTLMISVDGEVKSSNLATYKETALAFVKSISTDLQTDQDFANAEELVKFCKKAEDELETAKKHALAQTHSIDELFNTIDELKEQLRGKRLKLDKLVKSRKDEIRAELRANACEKLQIYVDGLNEKLEENLIPDVTPDFGSAMKGKKTVDSLQNAVDDELAKAKIAAKDWFHTLRENKFIYSELASDDVKFLFPDFHQLLLKDSESFRAMVKSRLAEHKEAEEAKQKEKQKSEQREHEEAPAEERPNPVTSSNPIRGDHTPTDNEIIQAVAYQFNVSQGKATLWIAGMKMHQSSDSAISSLANFLIDKIADSTNKRDLEDAGKEICMAKDRNYLSEADYEALQTSYRAQKSTTRNAA
ncbi:YqaJ viral recombinase family protein [Idiomarina aminovorans]|uniref:YqaJ viral recombinase family protein n=1 Tax=Idiomarina aminovorans TaxID=2914829 RepID=UPI0020054BE2|nr:YqaJ viral recombinase family protein [Idiomarina sp. ATCH4]MCK7458468.1 YqaJ viral recombinase family protein [Idiomarina sp. ATCH4]